MKFKTFKVADVSIRHIKKSDHDILVAHSNCDDGKPGKYPLTVLQYGYGFQVGAWLWNKNVGATQAERVQTARALLAAGHSDAFIVILRMAGMQGSKWLCLDCDGEEYNDLPSYGW